MAILLKTPSEIAAMREGGHILGQILQTLGREVKVGIKTLELNDLAEKLIKEYDVQASFKNYRGFPASICTAVNEEVVHSIPGERKLEKGDIISLDCGVYHKGLHTDSAITVFIPPLATAVLNFISTVKKALYQGIKMAKPGNKVGDISHTIEKLLSQHGYSPVHELTGHGVGKNLHEPPPIPNFGKKNSGEALKPGMTIAIEPIAVMGERYIKTLDDRWTIVTRDGSLACQIEHTIVITAHGNEILTN